MDPQHPPSRSQHSRLLEKYGAYCQGCGCDFTDNPSALEVDHIWPRSEGGTDAYENLTLLCPPCNRTKSDTMTITGLQQRNRREGILRPENEVHLKLGRGAKNKWRAAFAAVEELLAQEAPEEWAAYKTAEAELVYEFVKHSESLLTEADVAQSIRHSWVGKRSADARLERKKAALAAALDEQPDEWASVEEYESKKAALEAAEVKAKMQLARAYPDEWKAYKWDETDVVQSKKSIVFLHGSDSAAASLEKLKAFKAEVKANLKAAMKVEAPEEWAAAPDEWKAYEKAYGEYEAMYRTQYFDEENVLETITNVPVNVIKDKEGFLKVWRKLPLVSPTEWAGSMADYRASMVTFEKNREARRWTFEENWEARRRAKEAAYEEYYEKYNAMTPDEWMEAKVSYLRGEYEHPVAEAKAALRSAAPDEWKAYEKAKEAIDIEMDWAAGSYARKAWIAAMNALAAAAPAAADAYAALMNAYPPDVYEAYLKTRRWTS